MPLERASEKLDIANLAFALIGESPISSLSSLTDPRAVNASAIMDQVILEQQADYHWWENQRVEMLTKDPDYVEGGAEPPLGSDPYGYRFALPALFIRPCRSEMGVVVSDESGTMVNHYFKGQFVYADAEIIHLNYLAEDDDPANWGPFQTKCVYHAVSILLAPARAKSATLTERLMNVYEIMVRKRMRSQASKHRKSNRGANEGRYIRAGRSNRSWRL